VRHSRWSKSGVWHKVFEVLSVDRDDEWGMIDATIVRAHQHKKRGARPRHRAQQRGFEHEDTRDDRCVGQPHRISSDIGASA
jgi:transposase